MFAVMVVLEHEDHRQLQHHGHVQGLEGRPLVAGAVAAEGDRDRALAVELGRQARAHRQGRAGADDAVGAQHALADVGDVHRTGPALAQAVAPAVDLQHHPLHVAALGDAVAVAAVGRDDIVVVGQVFAHADRDGFLAAIEVGEAGDFALGDLGVKPLLELADRLHLAVGPEQGLAWQLHAASLGVLRRRIFSANE